MRSNQELDQNAADLDQFRQTNAAHQDTMAKVLQSYHLLLEDYKRLKVDHERLKSEYEEARDARDRYKQLARGQEQQPLPAQTKNVATPPQSAAPSSVADSDGKVCHFFQKGMCKYGKNCKNLHVKPTNGHGRATSGTHTNLEDIKNWRERNPDGKGKDFVTTDKAQNQPLTAKQ
jgi:hypothetical protein